ncbi:MAG: TonB-dependent receptor [Bacteroidales bacterium]|nr:TonB-dependent receptor [Bacteroidales bacterium]
MNNLKRKSIIYLICLLLQGCGSGLLFAQSYVHGNTVTLSGFVMDSQKRALELVNVYEQNSHYGISTDENGYYEIELPALDTLILRFSCLSYQTAYRIVPVEMNRISLNVVLQNSSQKLQDVSVSAQRRQLNSLQHIDADDIRLLPDPSGGSIEALLVTFAGVSSNNEMSTQYSVRGGNYDENLVYVNGIEIYRPLLIRSGQQEGLSFVNPQMTSSVVFSAGGFGAEYGDKMSSVLDIQYKQPEDFEASFHASLLGSNVFVGDASKDGRFSQIHGLRYKTNTYLLGSLQTKGEYQSNYFDYQTYLSYRLHDKWELSFLGNLSQNSYGFQPESRETEMGSFQSKYSFRVYFDGQEKDVFRTAFGALSLNHQANKQLHLRLQASAFRTDEQENYDITGQYWLSQTPINDNKADTANANLIGVGTYHEHARNQLNASVINLQHSGQWNFQPHQLQWGLAYQIEKIDDRLREWEMRDSSGYSLPFSDSEINFVENLRAESQMLSYRVTAYLQDTWKTRTDWGLLSLSGGLRANYWSYNHEWLFSPRFNIGFIPAWEKDFSFRLAGGIYYQAPFYKELRDTVVHQGLSTVVLNSQIKAPKSTQILLGMDYHFLLWDRPFKLTAEAYYKDLRNIIPYTVDNVRIRYEGINNGYGHTAGCDVKLFGEFVPGTDSWISLSLMDSKETIDDYSIPRPNEQRYNISMFFRDYLPNNPKYSMTLKFVWADGLCFGPPSMDKSYAVNRMKAYRRVDIGLSRRLVGGEDKILKLPAFQHIENVWISLDCFNLLGIKNTNSYYWVRDISNREWAVPNYLTGRQLNLSISVDF